MNLARFTIAGRTVVGMIDGDRGRGSGQGSNLVIDGGPPIRQPDFSSRASFCADDSASPKAL